jgi:hypothetical protein
MKIMAMALYKMRAFILLFLSCASVLGTDTNIQVVTTAKTNSESGSITTKETFTRDGQTNLVRNTKTTAGIMQIRIHRFYKNGLLVGDYVAMPDSSSFTTEAASPYSIGFMFGPSNVIKSAEIASKDGVLVDAFSCTNGLFFPVENSLLQKANAVGEDLKQLLAPEHVRTTSPEDFRRDVDQLIEKHKEN